MLELKEPKQLRSKGGKTHWRWWCCSIRAGKELNLQGIISSNSSGENNNRPDDNVMKRTACYFSPERRMKVRGQDFSCRSRMRAAVLHQGLTFCSHSRLFLNWFIFLKRMRCWSPVSAFQTDPVCSDWWSKMENEVKPCAGQFRSRYGMVTV